MTTKTIWICPECETEYQDEENWLIADPPWFACCGKCYRPTRWWKRRKLVHLEKRSSDH